MCYRVNLVQTSASKGLLRMVRRPAHGPRVDVIQLAARAWAPIIITLSVFKQVLLAISHYSRDGAVVTDRNERQPPQNGGGGHDVDDRFRFGLIQLLRSALTSLPPPRGGIPEVHNGYSNVNSLHIMYSLPFWCAQCLHKVYIAHAHLPGA